MGGINTTSFNILKLDIDYIGGTTYENRLLIGDTNSVVDIRFDYYPGYIENVHSIYFEGDVNGIYDAGISTLKSGGNVTDLIFFDPANSGGKTLSQLADSAFPANPQQGDIIYRSATAWERLPAGTTPGYFLQTQGAGANPVWAASGGGESLWEVDGSNLRPITARPLDIRNQNLLDVDNITLHDNNSVINMSNGKVDNVNSIDAASSVGTYIYDSAGALAAMLGATASSFIASKQVDMNGQDIIGVDDITMAGVSSILNMNSGNIINCGDIELYDGTTTSPRLNFCVPLSEEDSGMYMSYSSADAELRWIDRESSTKLMKIDWWGDLWVHRNISQNNDTKHYFNTNGSAYIKQSTSNNLTFYDSVTGEKTLADIATNEGLWEKTGSPEYTRLMTPEDIDLQNKYIYFDKSVTGHKIYKNGDNLIIQPNAESAGDSVAIKGRLHAEYGLDMDSADIIDVNNIIMQSAGAGIDMNYTPIYDSGDITLYDAAGSSPKLTLRAVATEGSNGCYLQSSGDTLYIRRYDTDGVILYIDTVTGEVVLSGDIDMNANDIFDIGDITMSGTTSDIRMEGGDIYGDSSASGSLNLYSTSNATKGNIEIFGTLDLNSYDITGVDDITMSGAGSSISNVDTIKGNSTTSLEIDLRGDDVHRIYYTGTSDNKMRYRTYGHHVFDVNGTVQLMIQNDGIHMQSGKKIKSDSGDLTLEVPSGSSVVFRAV